MTDTVPSGEISTPVCEFPMKDIAPADDLAVRRSEGTLVELRDGSVLFAYASHSGRKDNDHAPLVCKRLNGEGDPLTPERILVPPPEGGLNAMSPALRRLADGRIGLLFSYRISNTEASRRFMTSADEGETWSDSVIVAEGGYKTGCHDRLTVHSSGRLLAPVHIKSDFDAYYLHVRVSVSDDHGANWRLGEPIELPKVDWPQGSKNPESGCIEPGIAERADGSLLMTIRTAMGTQFCSESFDCGGSWSEPRSMEVISPTAPANLSRIPGTDDLLLLWTSDYCAKLLLSGRRHTIMACVSKDGGRSWPHASRRILVQDMQRSIDYPSVLYKGSEVWITLRVSTGEGILQGRTSTCLLRVPLSWFYVRP
jgi:sialidase-1